MSAPTGRRLRDYQADDIDAVGAAWAAGIVRPAIVWATGLGKSDPIGYLATEEAARGGHVLILAHRTELLDQLRDRCRAYAPAVRVGRVQAAHHDRDAPIITATVQTAARADRRERLRRPTLLIIDEAHHAQARTYRTIMEWAGCFDERTPDHEPTPALGVTATMSAEDAGLGDVWEKIVAERGIVWGIENGPSRLDPYVTAPVGPLPSDAASGWLVPLQGLQVVADHVDLSKAKISKTTGDYRDSDVGEMVAQDAPEVVKAWEQHAFDDHYPLGRTTGVFVPTIEAAETYLAAFCDRGHAAEIVTGKTPREVRGDATRRTGIYGRLATGATRVLVSVGVLTEGWDCPPVSCILVARPTKIPRLYQQMVGRGTRQLDPALWPGFPPKLDCLVLDVVGMTRSVHLRTLVDLVHSAPYRRRPCTVCGTVREQPGPCATCAAADPDDTESPLDPDESPDAGMGGGIARPDGRRRLIGPADYVPVDLLASARDSGLNWLLTFPEPGFEGIPFVVAGDYFLILWHEADGSWTSGYITRRGALVDVAVIERTSRDRAREAVEALCAGNAGRARLRNSDRSPAVPNRTDDPWRLARVSPTDRQLALADSMGITEPERFTSGGLSDLIDRVKATLRLTG